jgi:hypothetical protein
MQPGRLCRGVLRGRFERARMRTGSGPVAPLVEGACAGVFLQTAACACISVLWGLYATWPFGRAEMRVQDVLRAL